jgi:hypothetical protein
MDDYQYIGGLFRKKKLQKEHITPMMKELWKN